MPKVNTGEQAFIFWLSAFKLPIPHRNYRFAPGRKLELDFAWPDLRAYVEIEGGIWRKGGGAHSRPAAIERDIEKQNLLTMDGWVGLRVTPADIERGACMHRVDALLLMAAASVEARVAAARRSITGSPSVTAGYVPPSSPF